MPGPALASEFPKADHDAWMALVGKVLKGRDFERTLVSRTRDGIRIEPLHHKTESPPLARASHRPWRVSQRVDHPDPAVANALALADLEGGADALTLSFAGAPAARGFGLSAGIDDLDRALDGVMLDLVAISLETAPFGGREALATIVELAARRGHALGDLTVDVGLDPLGGLASSGRLPMPWSDLAARVAETAAAIRGHGFGGTAVRVDTRPYHEAGASEAQELAAALATGVAYMRVLEAGGHTLEEARDALSFLLVADADQFLTVAKLRALRRLWADVETACGLAPRPIRLHVETAWRMATRRDPRVNLLRGTVAAFSAGIGGADSVAILPFTAAHGLPDAFARRLARTTQLILIEESNLWRVADPVAGSGGFETLTDALIAEAWTRFQEIEREGGLFESLRSGALQSRIATTRAGREADVATRRAQITGTSEFPDLAEEAVAVLMPFPIGGQLADAASAEESSTGAGPLPSIRDAEPFEALRDRSDAHLAATGSRPRMFLATLGPLAAFSARAAFAKNLFEAGGIEAVANDSFPSHAAMADSFAASGCRLACLCSSDEVYATDAAAAAAALTARGALALYLAGRPGALEPDLAAAGGTRFVFAGCDVVAILQQAYRDLGAA